MYANDNCRCRLPFFQGQRASILQLHSQLWCRTSLVTVSSCVGRRCPRCSLARPIIWDLEATACRCNPQVLLVSLSLTPRDVASGCILPDARPKALSLLVLRKLKVSSCDYAGSSSYSPQKLTTLGVGPSSKPYCPKFCKRSSKAAMGGRSTIPAKAVGPKAEQSSQEEIETPKISPPEQKGEVPADCHQRDASSPDKSAEEAHTSKGGVVRICIYILH